MRILVVGAGCTGALTALKLRELLGSGTEVDIWEKARDVGGRYMTCRATVASCELHADLGAQYASVDPEDADTISLMESLVKAGVAKLIHRRRLSKTEERPTAWRHYFGIPGQNSIIKEILSRAGATVFFEKQLSKLDRQNNGWRASSLDGLSQQYECVVMCVPGSGPRGDNLNKIRGSWQQQLPKFVWQATEVPHDCRFALALFLRPGRSPALSTFFEGGIERNVQGDNLELLAWQSRKQNEPLNGPQVVVAHTRKGPRGDLRTMLRPMISEACRLLKIPPSAVAADKMITWYQSQVLQIGLQDECCLVAAESPPLLLAGDYLTSSTFTGCAQTAAAVAAEASRLLRETMKTGLPRGKRPLQLVETENSPVRRVRLETSAAEEETRCIRAEQLEAFAAEDEKRRKRAERFGL